MDLDELLHAERYTALYAKKRLILWKGSFQSMQAKMSDSNELATNLVNPQPFAIQFSCWGFGSDIVHKACLYNHNKITNVIFFLLSFQSQQGFIGIIISINKAPSFCHGDMNGIPETLKPYETCMFHWKTTLLSYEILLSVAFEISKCH